MCFFWNAQKQKTCLKHNTACLSVRETHRLFWWHCCLGEEYLFVLYSFPATKNNKPLIRAFWRKPSPWQQPGLWGSVTRLTEPCAFKPCFRARPGMCGQELKNSTQKHSPRKTTKATTTQNQMLTYMKTRFVSWLNNTAHLNDFSSLASVPSGWAVGSEWKDAARFVSVRKTFVMQLKDTQTLTRLRPASPSLCPFP